MNFLMGLGLVLLGGALGGAIVLVIAWLASRSSDIHGYTQTDGIQFAPTAPEPCNHFFVDGFGGMGDAVVCTECGLDMYPDGPLAQRAVARAKVLGRYIAEGHPLWASYVDKVNTAQREASVHSPI